MGSLTKKLKRKTETKNDERPRRATPEETKAFWNHAIEDGIKPHADTIAPIIDNGRIACVVFEVEDDDMKEAAHNMGWDGVSPVFEITPEIARWFAGAMRRTTPNDKVTPDWFESNQDGRIYLLIQRGSFLLNVDETGISTEPGSTDLEWMD